MYSLQKVVFMSHVRLRPLSVTVEVPMAWDNIADYVPINDVLDTQQSPHTDGDLKS